MKRKPFDRPQRAVGSLDAREASRVVAAAADVALVMNLDGVVRDWAFRSAELHDELGDAADWAGRAWSDTVTVESRDKVRALLDSALGMGETQLRHLNHPSARGPDVAVEYAAVRAGDTEVVAFGRDLRPISLLQQRLIDAQQAMERDYASLRQTQTRYRLLFDTAPEPLLLLDVRDLRVMEANPSARRLAGPGRGGAGWMFIELFDASSRPAVARFLAAIGAGGRGEPLHARLTEAVEMPAAVHPSEREIPAPGTSGRGAARSRRNGGRGTAKMSEAAAARRTMDGASEAHAGGTQGAGHAGSGGTPTLRGPDVLVQASLLIEDDVSLLLVRVLSDLLPAAAPEARLLSLELAPDGFVSTDADGRVLAANAVFAAMAQLDHASQAAGRPLASWLGQAGVDTELLLANLRQRGSVRLFATTMRGEHGLATAVEVSASATQVGDTLAFGFAVRDVARRLGVADAPVGTSRSAEQLTELIGRVSLKDLVRDATDVIERLCIEAALELTDDNRASAAEMLGLSRQGLYAKLHRYGLGDLSDPGEDR